jgi:hypothetical protein
MMRRPADRPAEEGFVLVFVALIVTSLMVFVAFSVDLGAAFNERRQDQSAADSGVLGGAQQVATGSRQAVGARAVEMARENLDASYSDAEWSALWAACDDVAPLDVANVVTVGGAPTECVSFDTSNTFVRVRLPNQLVKTAFANVVGIGEIPVHASAVARILPPGHGGLLPFGVLGNATDGIQLCLRSASTGLAEDPCSGSEQGNFGTIISPLFGNDALGTPRLCAINENTHTPYNLALGLDHLVVTHPNGGSPSLDRTDREEDCLNNTFAANVITTDTGFSGQRVYEGLVGESTFGSKGIPARLLQGDGPWRNLRNGNKSTPLDNQPLWEFIDDDPSGTPASCHRSLFPPDGPSNYSPTGTVQMRLCLTDYTTGSHSGELFGEKDSDGDYAILSSPRLGFVPQFWSNTFGTGQSQQRVKSLRAVFLQGLYFKSGNDWAVFQPGEATNAVCLPQSVGCKSLSLKQVTGYLLPDVALPSEVIENGPNGSLGPYQIQLWR